MKKIRCAIYTRKSSEEGLEQEFNSLNAQREACEAYVASQRHEGWVLLPQAYDDGGLSGGSLERPALQEMLNHMKEGRIDQIVVYKIDRLTRSLADFARIVDILDAANASFVSVTQSFNTATSMGRLTLNMLLSFAQFEREVTTERIRDKIAASKRKGLWMGGKAPIGYDPDGRSLKINEEEAQTVHTIYNLYERLGSIRAVREETERLGLRSRQRRSDNGKITGGGFFDRGHIHYILTNPVFAGRIRHRKVVHEGLHDAIIDPERWNCIQQQLQDGASRSRAKASAKQRSLLCGKLFDETGDRLTPSHSKTRKGIRLRYYISHRLVTDKRGSHPDAWRLPAKELEETCADAVRSLLRDKTFAPDILKGCTADEIVRFRTMLTKLADFKEPTQVINLLERIDIAPGNLRVRLDAAALVQEFGIAADDLGPELLSKDFPFRLRKRGVETRLTLADNPVSPDETLISNVARAYVWFEQLLAGRSFAEIARSHDTSSARVLQMIDLAFLAPDLVRDVLDGKQPLDFTSDWCARNTLPSDWSQQRQLLSRL